MSYPFLVATSYELCAHRSGMADAFWPRPIEVHAIVDIDRAPLFVCDDWITWDRSIVAEYKAGWTEPRGSLSDAVIDSLAGLAELVLEIAS